LPRTTNPELPAGSGKPATGEPTAEHPGPSSSPPSAVPATSPHAREPVGGAPATNAARARELGLRPQTVDAIESFENIKRDPIGEVNREPNHNHYKAARREANNEVVARRPDGRPFNHIRDLQEHYRGLDNVRQVLEAEIEYPPPGITERGLEVLLSKYSELQSTMSRLKGFLDGIGYGPPFPPFRTWPPGT
jgi:Bacterial toxin 28